jgi:hypothetical protein
MAAHSGSASSVSVRKSDVSPIVDSSLTNTDSKNGMRLLKKWEDCAKQQVSANARACIPEGESAFALNAPTSYDGGVVLLESMRRILCEPITPALLKHFGDRLPGDMADYLHPSASYVMYDFLVSTVLVDSHTNHTVRKASGEDLLVLFLLLPPNISLLLKLRWGFGRIFAAG